MPTFGRRILEIGVCSVLFVLIISVSCVMSGICPSGYVPGSEQESSDANKLTSNGGGSSGSNIIGTEDEKIIKDIRNNKEVQAKGNNSYVNDTFSPTTEGTITSTTNKEPVSVIIFAANNHYGRSAVLTFTNRECQNLPELIQNRVNSINTLGECVILCDNLDCGGWCIKFAPGTPAHHRFRKLRFHNRAESAISCE